VNWRTIRTGFTAHLLWIRHVPTRRERRIWVSALYLSIAAEDVLIAAIKTPAGTPSLWARLGGLIGLLFAFLVWNRLESWSIPVISESAFGPTVPVDERQQAVRDRSYRRAYQAVFLASLVSAVVAYVFQDDLPGFLRRISELKLLFVALLQIVLLLASLPAACLAWTEPDESEGKPVEEISPEVRSVAGE
jgi:hypothetical protein